MIPSLDNVAELAFDEENVRVRVFFSGYIVWTPKVAWKTHCTVDVKSFPYDEQTCFIRFEQTQYVNFVMFLCPFTIAVI